MQNFRAIWNFRYRVATNVIIAFVWCVWGKKVRFSAEQFSPEKSVKIIMTEHKEFKFELIGLT